MIDDKQKIQTLTYALGLAIGALETINLSPDNFNKSGLAGLCATLKEIADPAVFYIERLEELK